MQDTPTACANAITPTRDSNPFRGSLLSSQRDYEHVVVSLFERKPIHVKLKAYKLSPGFSISALKSVRYSEVGANVFYFTLMTPQAKFKMIKFGSDNADQMRDLHDHVTRFTGIHGR